MNKYNGYLSHGETCGHISTPRSESNASIISVIFLGGGAREPVEVLPFEHVYYYLNKKHSLYFL